jgi:hypothetical protein
VAKTNPVRSKQRADLSKSLLSSNQCCKGAEVMKCTKLLRGRSKHTEQSHNRHVTNKYSSSGTSANEESFLMGSDVREQTGKHLICLHMVPMISFHA